MKEVIWAMTTRADPKTNIEIIENCWATPLRGAGRINSRR
jgi:UbiD family decarboxylase